LADLEENRISADLRKTIVGKLKESYMIRCLTQLCWPYRPERPMRNFFALAAAAAVSFVSTPALAQNCPSPGPGGVYATEPPPGCLKLGQTVKVRRTPEAIKEKRNGCSAAIVTVTGGQGSVPRQRRCGG